MTAIQTVDARDLDAAVHGFDICAIGLADCLPVVDGKTRHTVTHELCLHEGKPR